MTVHLVVFLSRRSYVHRVHGSGQPYLFVIDGTLPSAACSTYPLIAWYLGLARSVHMHRTWPYSWWFPCRKHRIYTVYIWFWPTLLISIAWCLLVFRCLFGWRRWWPTILCWSRPLTCGGRAQTQTWWSPSLAQRTARWVHGADDISPVTNGFGTKDGKVGARCWWYISSD